MKALLNGAVYGVAAFMALSVVGCGKKKADVVTAIETLEAVGKARAKPTSSESALSSRTSKMEASVLGSHPGEPSWPPAPDDDFGGSPSPAPAPSHNTVVILGQTCSLAEPNMSASLQSSMEFKIGGDSCPIEFLISTKFDQNSMTAKTSFKARTEDAKKLSDVDELSMQFELTTSKDQKSAELSMELTAHSQKKGNLEMNMEGEVTGKDEKNVSGELTGKLVMGDSEADLKQVVKIVDGKEQNEYYINGEKLTEEQMKRVVGAMVENNSKSSGASIF